MMGQRAWGTGHGDAVGHGDDVGHGASGEHDAPVPENQSEHGPAGSPESTVTRRDALKVFGSAPLLATLGVSAGQLERALRGMERAASPMPQAPSPIPHFFTAHEWRTLGLLTDYIIPRDARSGSATDAKVPEFIDFLMADNDASAASKTEMRGGLAWIDGECRNRFNTNFANSTDAQRRQVLDDIAWPKKAPPEMSHGVAFFRRLRDLTASGFFSSAMGWRDVQYQGNVYNPHWNGCPPEALRKLGVSY